MPQYRSRTTTHGRNMAGARGLWRATGMKDGDFGKPIIAIANSFTQFVPGHVHLKDMGQLVAREIEAAGGVAKEFNTIAVDDGIAMGHDGMLYSLPSRDLIADSVEYMVNAHCADALVCISNCDKITPGMLMAAMRLNIPTVFVSGGPMEAGKVMLAGKAHKVDLIDAMIAAADDKVSDEEVAAIERSACPTCGSCSGMFTANSMNCLTEALGLVAARQRHDGGDACRPRAPVRRGRAPASSSSPGATTSRTTPRVLPRAIATFEAFENAMTLDIAMGGSTNTVLHLLAAAQEGEVDFTMADIDRLSRRVPVLCKVAPSVANVPCRGRAPRRRHHGHPGRARPRRPDRHRRLPHRPRRDAWRGARPLGRRAAPTARRCTPSSAPRPAACRRQVAFSQEAPLRRARPRPRRRACIRDMEHAYSQDGGLAVLYGNLAEDGCIVKTAGVDASILHLHRPGARLRKPGRRGRRHPRRQGRRPATWW